MKSLEKKKRFDGLLEKNDLNLFKAFDMTYTHKDFFFVDYKKYGVECKEKHNLRRPPF